LSDAEHIEQRLSALFVDSFHFDPPTPDLDLIETGILDSHQLAELLLTLEREFRFSIAVEDIDLDDLRTVQSVARLIAKRTAENVTTTLPVGATG